MSNFSSAQQTYLKFNAREPKIVGMDAYDGDILTDDYQIFRDYEGNLFKSDENALKFYGIEEVEL